MTLKQTETCISYRRRTCVTRCIMARAANQRGRSV